MSALVNHESVMNIDFKKSFLLSFKTRDSLAKDYLIAMSKKMSRENLSSLSS